MAKIKPFKGIIYNTKKEIDISQEYATAMFRITQEALTNIIRHSEAKNVKIKIKTEKSKILLEVKDEGKGIAEQHVKKRGKTFGVFGMKERATSLGGSLKIKNNNKQGTTVNLILPYKQIFFTNHD